MYVTFILCFAFCAQEIKRQSEINLKENPVWTSLWKMLPHW